MTAPEPERKTRAIVFSDIKGYSRLMGEDESLALRLLEEHNAVCAPLIKESGGTILKYIGDAILSSFESASDAVHYGMAVQRALAERNARRPENERIVVRIGIHIGDVVFKDGDVFGDGVNIAARIEPLAEPGGIAISQTVYDMIRARPEIQTVSLGPKDLKNIKESVNIYKVLVEAHEGAGGKASPARRRGLIAAAAAALLAAAWLGARRLTARPDPDLQGNLLANPGFESGLQGWKAMDGSVTASDAPSKAHGGRKFAESFLSPGKRSVTLWAADASGEVRYFPVNEGDVVTFGVWASRVSGQERVGCKLRVSDATKEANEWPGPTPYEAATASWTKQKGSFTVPPGKKFVAFFLEILAANDVSAGAVTVGRFDDAFLRVTPAAAAAAAAAR